MCFPPLFFLLFLCIFLSFISESHVFYLLRKKNIPTQFIFFVFIFVFLIFFLVFSLCLCKLNVYRIKQHTHWMRRAAQAKCESNNNIMKIIPMEKWTRIPNKNVNNATNPSFIAEKIQPTPFSFYLMQNRKLSSGLIFPFCTSVFFFSCITCAIS